MSNKFRKQLITELGGCCIACGCSENFEIHHRSYPEGVKKNGMGKEVGTLRMLKYAKEDIYMLLCVACHRILHENYQIPNNKKVVKINEEK